jgi:CHAT domain-containing protein
LPEAGTRLRRAVWDPLAEWLGAVREVYVVPDGALFHVNLAALPAEAGGYLLEHPPLLRRLYAERDLAAVPRSARGEGLLVIAASGHGLRGARAEGEAVARLWGSAPTAGAVRLLTGADATEEGFRRHAPGRRAVHVAAHAFYRETELPDETWAPWAEGLRLPPEAAVDPLLRSGLVLAGAAGRAPDDVGEDGLLTSAEIAATDLDGVELVVLAGCHTAAGRIERTEGVVGLQRAFRSAGAGTIVTSLWELDDVSAAFFTSAFHRSLLRDPDPATAVRSAARRLLEAGRQGRGTSHPRHWGAFVAIEGSRPPAAPPQRQGEGESPGGGAPQEPPSQIGLSTPRLSSPGPNSKPASSFAVHSQKNASPLNGHRPSSKAGSARAQNHSAYGFEPGSWL